MYPEPRVNRTSDPDHDLLQSPVPRPSPAMSQLSDASFLSQGFYHLSHSHTCLLAAVISDNIWPVSPSLWKFTLFFVMRSGVIWPVCQQFLTVNNPNRIVKLFLSSHGQLIKGQWCGKLKVNVADGAAVNTSADEADDDPEITSRKEKSLGLLCQRFLIAINEETVGSSTREVHLETVARKMSMGKDRRSDSDRNVAGVEKRRIYDIVNVMEALDAMQKTNKSYYQWQGLESLPKLMSDLQVSLKCFQHLLIHRPFRMKQWKKDFRSGFSESNKLCVHSQSWLHHLQETRQVSRTSSARLWGALQLPPRRALLPSRWLWKTSRLA